MMISPQWRLYLRVAYLGCTFAVLFTGFNVAQSFVTTLFPGSFGFTILLLVYLTYGFSSMLTPLIHEKFKDKVGQDRIEILSMFIGSLTYVFFVISLALRQQWMVIIGSLLVGCGAGWLWIGQGVWLAKIVQSYEQERGRSVNVIGTTTGIFFTVFNLNGVVGNVVAIATLLSPGGDLFYLVWVMVVVVAVGCGMLLFTAAPKFSQTDAHGSRMSPNDNTTKTPVSFRQLVAERWEDLKAVVCLQSTLLLTPYFLCQGFNIAYNFGNLPTFVTHFSSSLAAPQVNAYVAYVFLAYGVGAMIGSLLWGKVYDLFHARLYVLLVNHFILVAVALGILLGVSLQSVLSPTPMVFQSVVLGLVVVGWILGLIDFLTNAIVNNSVSKIYSQAQVPVAFAWYRFCFCIGFCGEALLSALVPGVHQGLASSAERRYLTSDNYGWLMMIGLCFFMMVVSVAFGWRLELSLSGKRGKQLKTEDSLDMLAVMSEA